jgi:hypothetical protein
LSNANIRRAHWEAIHAKAANLKGANMLGIHLNNADLENANLNEAYLPNAVLTMANLQRASLCNSVLGEADFGMAHIEGANFERAIFGVGIGLLNSWDISYQVLNQLKSHPFGYHPFGGAFINKMTNFTGTIHEGKTIEEIKAYRPPKLSDEEYEKLTTLHLLSSDDN